jgi:osmotically-inducible protein OsmY
MKMQTLLKRAVAPTVLLTAMFAIGAYAQELSSDTQNVPAKESFDQAGQQTDQAAQSTSEGVKTAVDDTAITAKVKAALGRDKVTSQSVSHIHVTTTTGIVTLKGTVTTVETLAQAELLARSTQGVRNVVNELQVKSVVE